MQPDSNKALWMIWGIMILGLSGILAYELFLQAHKPSFLIGETSHGHYQIEMACTTCHTQAFGGPDLLQDACMTCHGAELARAQDSHPRSKFTDPRNADRLAKIDARFCVSCHQEHNEDITGHMGVTRPVDLCVNCHEDIAPERPSHEGMAFETCASAGCHNFHDNRALYEDFLTANAGAPWLDPHGRLPESELADYLRATNIMPEDSAPASLPAHLGDPFSVTQAEWEQSAHARGNVGCNSCHGSAEQWTTVPGPELCAGCHGVQSETFAQGRHGMRLANNLSPMQPSLSVEGHNSLAFRQESLNRQLGCNTCHEAHSADTLTASVSACLGCHADEHSLAYSQSPHGQLWQQVEAGLLDKQQTVSCAGCHMPVDELSHAQGRHQAVQHNQNDNLRPNEKMIRSVCMHCHSLSFSIDALADQQLLETNFNGQPDIHIESIDMALDRIR